MSSDRYNNGFRETALKAVGKLGEMASTYKGSIPDEILDAIVFTVTQVTSMADLSFEETEIIMKLLFATHKNCYRAGYNNGQKTTESIFKVNQG